jgi:PAS domain S-box-containing protein
VNGGERASTSQDAKAAARTMAALVSAHDWARTPLGPIENWPQSLRVAVGICLNSRFPMFVWWGPQLINIYNDAYIPVLGKRHPRALGRPARQNWEEIWPVVGPQADAVMQRGEATWNERVLLMMERHGFTEETYFTWSYSPIPDDRGGIGGLFCACTEDTPRVMAERERDRLAGQRQIALNAARMGWWHYDPETKISTWDRRFAEIFGIAGTQAPNEQILRRLHPDDLPVVWASVEAALDPVNPMPYSVAYRILRDNGAVRWVEAHGLADFVGEGAERRAVSFVGTVTDVTERKLTEEQPRTILESITDAFFALDRQWRFTYVNRQAQRVLERTPGELLGQSIWDVYPGLEESEFGAAYRRAGEERVAVSLTSFYSDHGRWYEVHAYPAPDGISVYFRDVSSRKLAEETLRASEARYRTLFESIDQGFCVVEVLFDDAGRPSDYRFLETNPAFERHTGLHGPGGRRARELVPDLEPHWVETYGRVAMTGKPERFVNGASGMGRRWFDVYAFRAGGADSRKVGILFSDITDRRQAEDAVRESTERLRLAVAIAQMGTFDIDLRSDAVTVNEPGREIYGWKPGEALTFAKVQTHFHPDDRKRVVRSVENALRPDGPGEFEVEQRIIRRDGAVRWIRVRGRAVFEEVGGARQAVRCAGAYLDITQQREAEQEREQLLLAERAARAEAERASEAKSEFLATLSHELRTPLTPVLLTVSLMESNPALPPGLREDVATIRRNVELESRLISDLLDLTRITKGKLQLDMGDVDLHLILRSAIDICQREASAKMVVDLRAPRHIVRGDSTRLQQIFWNLINNAQKFTGPEGTVTVRSLAAPDGRIRVEVSDTGAGIDPAVLPRLFNAFEQGEVRAAQQQAGLGLGLAISKKLTEAHGGTIAAASDGRGRGATFAVELPAPSVFVPETTPPRAPRGLARAAEPLNVLIVEDHEPTLRVMVRLLKHLGHSVTGVMTVAAATSAARQDGFDLIISDLGLPDGSGLDVMRQLRDRYTGRAIALTGYGMDADIAASREAGFAAHLTKPVDVQALESAIRRLKVRP